MRRTERGRLVAGGTFVLVLLGYVVLNFKVTADVSHFLPAGEDRDLSSVSRQLAESELSRTMILTVEAEDSATALAAGRAFEEALLREPRVSAGLSFLEGGPAPGLERALFELYEPRRLSFLASEPSAVRARLSESGLREAARRLRTELAGPLSPLVTRVAPRDPFMTIPTLFRTLGESRASRIRVMDSRFVTEDGQTAVLFLGTQRSALDARAQAPFLDGVRVAWDQTVASFDAPIRLDQSGVNRFATRQAEAIEGDIKRVSIVSSVLLGGLLLLLFRSLRFVGLAAIPILVGVIAGCAIVLAVLGRLHGITLAFGAALIGVSVDYVVHLYCHHTIVRPEGGSRASLRAILRPLTTGAITTVAGFVALSATDLSGLREVALFAIVGILSAFAATVTMLPALIPDPVAKVPLRDALVERVTRGFHWLQGHRAGLAAIPLAALVFMAFGLPRARWNPDLASMGRMDPALLEEDQRVQQKVAPFEQMRFVVAMGDDEEAALQVNDSVSRVLEDSIVAGELKAQRSLAALLPSAARQQDVAVAARSSVAMAARVRRVFGEEGFAPGAFDPFVQSLAEPGPPPLVFGDLADSPIGSLIRSHRVTLGERVGILTFLHGVREPEAIEARLDRVPDSIFLRQADLLGQAQLEYQQSTGRILGWGLLAVFVLLGLRYRDLRRTCVSFFPSVLAAGVTVSALTLAGRGMDLISLTALLFVVSMGVDYSVFLVDAEREGDERGVAAALSGALLACVSTVVAFGLLAISEHPVLSDLGLTAAVGIGTSLLLAPTALVLAGSERGQGEQVAHD